MASPSSSVLPPRMHHCHWDWCRLTFPTNQLLLDHVIYEHVRKAQPVRRCDLPMLRRAEEGFGDSLSSGMGGILSGSGLGELNSIAFVFMDRILSWVLFDAIFLPIKLGFQITCSQHFPRVAISGYLHQHLRPQLALPSARVLNHNRHCHLNYITSLKPTSTRSPTQIHSSRPRRPLLHPMHPLHPL